MHFPGCLLSKIRAVLLFVLIAALLPAPYISGLMKIAAQGQGRGPDRQGQPKPGKPEGVFPDLEYVQEESNVQREPAPPIHSTIRSPKNPLNPWNGLRVGDPATRGELGQAMNRQRRAHAGRRVAAPPPVLDDQFIENFFNWAVLRALNGNEPTYWKDQFRVAYAQGQTSLKLAAVELGKTLFESAEYAARGRDNHWYVYDLYKTYLMRDPDSSGWAFWETQVGPNGRENVRRAFEESPEFGGIVASIVPNGSATANAASLISARVDPKNQPGNGMLARDATWSVSLLSLPGRAGLDLGLALSYSSMVWTSNGPYIHFDEDNGYPSPGFRLGFPTVQRKVFDAQTGKNSFLMISATGRRAELRQVGSSNVYESGDSSYLQLTDNSPNLLLRSTDGTQLSFVEINNEYSCTQVKDRNGNYITVNHNGLGRITAITDTLGRVINFNYDINANLISITQSWNGQTPPHQWVSFSWGTRNMQASFSTGSVIGPKNGTVLPVVTQVTLNDTSQVTFDYNNSLQVNLIRNEFGAIQRNETTFTYETPTNDVPRLSDSRVSARNWTGINGVPSQVITTYSVAGDGACVMTAPDGTVYKEYYGTGWQRGLTTLSEVWTGAVRQKWTTTSWTQDNTSVGYELNPRITETNVQDGTSQRRTVIDYGPYAQWGLPYAVKEYAANGTTEIRQTYTDYNLNQAYLDRRIIGLVAEVHLTNVSQYQGKISYSYDDPTRLQSVPSAATQHDSAYSTSFTARGNLTAVSRWDFTDITNASKKLTTYTNYYTTGLPSSTTDPLGHQSIIAYGDSFSDNINRNTFAYPTTVTDGGGFSSNIQYNFDFAATTRTQTPAPAGQSQGAIQELTYNNLGQLERIKTTNSSAYTRFWYGADFTASYATVNNAADESYSMRTFDGLGRPLGAASNHPGSTGGYRAKINIYDFMGRVKKSSNPAETTSNWVPFGDDSAGWLYTEQTYDWKGRPLITTNPNTTTREASYSGCGCAGGQVVTLIDEGTIDGGTPKRRKQKIYSDVFGRTSKTEVFVWQTDTVYSTVVNTYNVRDQLEQVREYAGSESSGTYQTTTMTYDGYGRLKTKHVPEQDTGADTVWTYNADDTIQKITDGRGAATINTYNSRHLITEISYTVPPSSQISVPPTITFTYDGAGNRTSMDDGAGSIDYTYDSLSRLTSESREFTELSGSYALNYSYNLGNALTSLSIPFRSRQIGYNYDTAGRLSGVTASGFSATYHVWPNQYTQNLTSFASNITYRAWGARKSMTYGNTTSEQITYNARLQTATYTLNNMNYQNTNVCCSYPTYSTMTWSYGYYDDGSLEHAWDATNDWFDRAYKYDHVGRLKEASTFRRARGLSPYPTINYPDPYFQSISYDAFNHSSRTGRLYTGEPSDTATYVNNRRTDYGWQYDADGNTISDSSYQHTIDASGQVIQSVSHVLVGDGVQYPYEPRLDITEVYDGTGLLAKRNQISRMPDPFGSGEPQVDTQTTYYINSSVLGGVTVAEIGWGNTIYIYANGQRIARDYWDNVTFEHHNPLTGSWVTTHGHSSYRTTEREERDPRGAEMPLQNPFVQDYVDWKFGEPLFIEGGDPFDYSSGREIDGMPVSEAEFQRRVGSGSAGAGVFVAGRFAGFIDVSRQPSITHVTVIYDLYRSGQRTRRPDFWYYLGRFAKDLRLDSGGQKGPRPTPKPQRIEGGPAPIGGLDRAQMWLEEALKWGNCREKLQQILAQLGTDTKFAPSSTDILDIFNKLKDQTGGGGVFVDVPPAKFHEVIPQEKKKVAGGGGLSNFYYTDPSNWRTRQRYSVVFLRYINTANPFSVKRNPYVFVLNFIHELTHNAPNDSSGAGKTYDDTEMDTAARNLGSTDFDQYVKEHCIPRRFWQESVSP